MSGLVEYELSDNESDNEYNESNLLLVDYKTEEEEERIENEGWKENCSEEKVLKRKKFDELTDEIVVISKKRGSMLKGETPRKDLPPLPSDFLQLYPDKKRKDYIKHIDDPSKHQGRMRSKPHVEGDWATYIYVEVTLTEEADHIINKIEELAKEVGIEIISCVENHQDNNNSLNELDPNGYYEENKLHISLSRPLFLKHHQIENFWNKLRKGFLNWKRFSLSFADIASFSNDDKTRSFMALEVGKGSNELNSMVDYVNKVAKDFRQKPFYENPRFHASILWALGETSIDRSLCDVIKETEYFESITQHVFNIEKMVCKIGNKTFTIDLK
ncbi:hypothetical protein RclHR1_02530004 [Rhizophagus clarus]|uniref:U6 snRNA phosphodiesterase n=1 Tax=Rhizophagus clarus TaxID=94130 RepID=A0A2Z6RCR4_9GLOM|nr:hypothetical protein RclHR1_02530004 [Rhizophagus clarus]GES75645.1 U6 snRNA phosphodiesterase-like [Rhizophagus clarus]